MPFIIKNGKYYGSGGGSGDSSIDLTQSEYDKLEASGKVNHDVTYYITDGVYEEGEGNTNIVKLTQVEYDALGDEKLSDNNIYLITDADELTAKNLAYDDSETGLGNNVQDAVDILNSKVDEQNKNLEGFKAITIDAPEGSGSTYATQPWLLLKYAYENNILPSYYHAGMMRCSSRFSYSGYLIESKTYGSWIIYGYSGDIFHVTYTNGTWKYAKTTSNLVEF